MPPTCATAARRPPPSWPASRATLERRAGRRAASRSTTTSAPRSRRELERLIRRREQLGPVNPLAEREYEEAQEHVDELEAQREDLEKALGELEGLIRETDREITAAFEETFEAAAEELRGAGRAPLPRRPRPPAPGRAAAPERRARRRRRAPRRSAVRPEAARRRPTSRGATRRMRPTATIAGVEIEVTPPARRRAGCRCSPAARSRWSRWPSSSACSSPGPSPFYILDEVEAALDDANIDRFLQLVRRFSDRAQFIDRHPPEADDGRRRRPLRRQMQDGATKVISAAARAALEHAELGRGRSRGVPRSRRLREPLPTLACGAAGIDLEELILEPARAAAPRSGRRRRSPRAAPRLASRACGRASREPRGAQRRALLASLFETLDAEAWERLEEALIMADVGARTTAEVVGRLEDEVEAGKVEGAEAVRERLIELLAELAATGETHDRPAANARRWSWSSASTAPARRRRSASSPGICQQERSA